MTLLTIPEDYVLHPAGMLDRDQRTAKMPATKQHRHHKRPSDNANVDLSVSGEIKSRDNCRKISALNSGSSRRSRYVFTKIIQRVKQVLVVGTYLLSIVHIPSALSAPIMNKFTDVHQAWNSPPKWINPLNVTDSERAVNENAQMAILCRQILDQTKLAYNSANNFVETFVSHHFGQSVDELNSAMYSTYDWLPSSQDIPKKHKEVIPPSDGRFAEIKLDDLIVHVYEQLQKIAVGLEQVVWSMNEPNSNADPAFMQKFANMEKELQMVLIELQTAIVTLNLKSRPDVTRYVMPEQYRDMDATGRVKRDWIIFRDYLNTLEYTIEALNAIRGSL